jgi:hypothetical protein
MAKKKEEEFDFELDEDDLIDEYSSEVDIILETLGKIDQDLASSVLTNSSKFVDFDLTDEELGEIITDIGFVIQNENKIVDIAKKLRDNA